MGVLAVLLLAAGYLMLIHRPVTAQLEQLAVRQEEAETQNMILEVKATLLDEMRAELKAIRADPDAVEIPGYDNLRKVMVFLNATLASTMDYDLNFRQVALPEEGRTVRRVIDMSFQCADYVTAREVVGALHASPYRCQLGDLAMAPIVDETDGVGGDLNGGGVSVTLTITFFERLS